MLEQIEEAADHRFVDLFHASAWWAAASGEGRHARPGFILVATDEHEAIVGFVHVLETDGFAHLEQLSVLPSHGRRGVGSALVRSALDEAARRGYRAVTLRTYAEVAWNAQFYTGLGFVISEPETTFHRGLRETEAAIGLERYGPRVQMTVEIGTTDGPATTNQG